ncbi:hemerythrin domain-containing protein [Phenylobacterium soli]|uniref:Iron-sulfur cluster repair di-iron protein n=1 Tax=Phenylobacterium soli TaxID=2170551 RepID=A0A328AKN6_9CAUL|nr:hemerythrin domain-containing protein [Phenylobacterium soli]RAK55159.1 iron-sulfur cluster repair di-iron protein [Phenylobacterium soli]
MLQSWAFLSGFTPPPRSGEPASAEALIGHVLERYHDVHRAEFPEAIRLARKVEAVHAGVAEAPRGLADHLALMFDDLEAHQQREERVLFPAMLNGGCMVVRHPIQRMMAEHEDVEAQLATLRQLSNGYVAPDDACRTWRALYAACRKLDEDLVEHMRIENEELFPLFLG